MRKFSGIILMIMGLTMPVFAQIDTEAFSFDKNPGAIDISDVSEDGLREHPMGIIVAKKMELLRQQYTYVEKGGPTSPTDKTIIMKPAIYNSIQKLNRHYRKLLGKNEITMDEAMTNFVKCLDIALMIYPENTKKFEQYLQRAGDPLEILEVYNKVVLE